MNLFSAFLVLVLMVCFVAPQGSQSVTNTKKEKVVVKKLSDYASFYGTYTGVWGD